MGDKVADPADSAASNAARAQRDGLRPPPPSDEPALNTKSIDFEKSAPRAPDPGDDVVFYRYTDANGRDVVTNEPQNIPRDAKNLRFVEGTPDEYAVKISPLVAAGFEPKSFALGVAIILVPLVLTIWMLKKGARSVIVAVVCVAAVVGLFGAYFSYALRTSGFDPGVVATPQDVMDQAKRTVERANANTSARDHVIEKLNAD
jgi:hypothetical protein